jgi:hypothetical protein
MRSGNTRSYRGLIQMPRYDDLSEEELDGIRRFIEDMATDDLRELVEKHWPWLLPKLSEPRHQQ